MYVLSNFRSYVNFHLKRFVCFRKGPDSALLPFVREFKFHLASFMAIVNMLAGGTELPHFSQHCTVLALDTNFGLGFVKSDVV
jgi:hypothetical protein